MKVRAILALALLMLLSGVNVSSAAEVTFPGARPFTLSVPPFYSHYLPEPLIIALTGYNQTGQDFENYLKLEPLTQSIGILYVHPDGTKNAQGVRFWNGTPECCNYGLPKVNDDAYIMSIIDQVSAKYAVDPKRIYVIGHSNGGFLASALACNHADRIAAIVSMAGASYITQSACKARAPVSVLEVWGSKDVTFNGNHGAGRAIPSALQIFKTWGAIDHCSSNVVSSRSALDLDTQVPGLETTVSEFQQCPAGTAIDMWQINGAGHTPNLSLDFSPLIINFFLDHPKQ